MVNRTFDSVEAFPFEMRAGDYVCLSVADTGTGMSDEVVQRAFDPFYTTKPLGQGTGLGLSMIYGFAKQSGGQVCISSALGQGTTVCVFLPRHSEEEQAASASTDLSSAPPAGAGEIVLIVEDEPSVRMLVSEVLSELGYTAIESADGASALQVLRSDARIGLLVTDVGLPDRMNGRQLADFGRTARPALKVLFITGYAENAAMGIGGLTREWLSCQNRLQWTGWQRALGNFYFARPLIRLRLTTISNWARGESRSRNSAQGDKWSFCLTAGTLVPANQERE